jgi:hypothetical protein
MCDGWPAGPAPCRFLQPIPTSRDRTRRSIPRFAHESDEISKAVYQALPLCIADKAVASYAPPALGKGGHCGLAGWLIAVRRRAVLVDAETFGFEAVLPDLVLDQALGALFESHAAV